MENDEGKKVDAYIPRKCSYTNRLIGAKDHASVQINVGHVDANGVLTGDYTAFALCGPVRRSGEGDAALNLVASRSGVLAGIIKAPVSH